MPQISSKGIVQGNFPLEEVWVRFYTRAPEGTAIRDGQYDDAVAAARHRAKATALGVDSERMGRGKDDSGSQLKDVRMTSIELLIADLRGLGYRLIDAFQKTTPRAGGGPDMGVVTFVFSNEGDEITLSPVDAIWFARRITLTHEKVTIWANAQTRPGSEEFTWRRDTINSRGARPDQPPRLKSRMLAVGEYSHDEQ